MANYAGGRLSEKQQRELNEKLFNACEKGNTEKAVQFITDGADVDYQQPGGRTVLGIASKKGHVDTVQQLLAHNASIEKRDWYQITAFLWSCWGGDRQTVKLLYDRGADVKAIDEWGRTAVHCGCISGNIELIQFLFSLGLSLQDTDKDEETCIFDACRWGHLEVIKFLMSQGLSVDSQNKYGETCLFSACSYGHLEVIKFLVSQGLSVDSQNEEGKTPMDELKKIESWYDDALKERKKKCLDYLQGKDKGAESSDSLVPDTSSKPVQKDDQSSGPSDEQSKTKDPFDKAMLEGGGKFCQSNVLMHGPPGAGKSSLKRVILGEDPLSEKEQNATKIIENPVRAVCAYRMKGFEVIDNSKLIEMLAETIEKFRVNISGSGKKEVNPQAVIKPPTVNADFQKDTEKDAQSPSLFYYGPSDDTEPPDFQVSDTTVTLRSISKKLKNVRPSSEMFDSQWYHLIDSGGQPQFYDILPLVYHRPSLNIVVIRLNEGLDDKPKVTFHSEGRNVYELPDKLQLTNRQFIIRMCQIASGCAKSGGPVSYVIVVGTHKDKLGKDGGEKIKQMNRELKSVYKQFKDVLIYKSNDEIIFDINTMATGKEREQYTKELQNTIFELCENHESQPVPLKWFAFQLDLDNDEGIVRMTKCYKSGKALGMNKTDVENALMYFDNAALLMYFPDDIPDLVLTKVDPLIDKLSDLVKASFIRPKLKLQSQCEKLRNKGLFNKSFLSELFQNTSKHTCSLCNDEFLKLLECLKIIVKLESEEFFLPSALSFQDLSYEGFEFKMSSVPLVFSWDEHILPHGFFFTVVVELLARPQEHCDYCFILLEDVPQWREEIQLSERERKIPGVIKIINRKQWIQISYSGDIIHCPKIFKVTDIAVRKAVERFKARTGIKLPTTTCLCPVCDSEDHYCFLTPDKKEFTCSSRGDKTGKAEKGMLCWFEGAPLTIDEKMCATLRDEIASQLQQSHQCPKGIAFIIGSFAVAGALFDVKGTEDTFISLKFAVYRGQNVDPKRLACLIHAAATFNYPIGCNVVAFYFAGHGGIDKHGQEFIISNLQRENGSLPINQYILEPFKQLKLQKNGMERTCLFFFDCCLSESNISHPTTNSFALKKQTFRSVVAYATVTGSKAKGDNIEGGIWTRHLVKQLRRKEVPLSTILDDTHQIVMEETKASSYKQLTHYVSTTCGVYLNGRPEYPEKIMMKIPDTEDVMEALEGVAALSVEFRNELKVSNDGDLKCAIKEWKDKEPVEPTWKKLITALIKSGNPGVARRVRDEYLMKPEVYKKYSSKPDYKPLHAYLIFFIVLFIFFIVLIFFFNLKL